MSAHIANELPRLLTGEATRDEVMTAAAHLRTCVDCQQELVSAVVAHASLTSAQRFAPEVIAPAHEDAELPGPLPDLSDVFAQARREAGSPATGRRRWRVAAAAAAAAVVIGGTTAAVVELNDSGSSAPATNVALAPFHDGTRPAEVTVRGTTMKVDASRLPRLDGQHFYEVWLTDKGRTAMWPLGAIGQDNRAQLPVPASVMARYAAIEVSVQRANQTGYSGVSVLRGTYG